MCIRDRKRVEVVIEKKVEVPVPKFVEVPVEKIIEKIVETEIIEENPIYVEQEERESDYIRKSATNTRLRKSYQENQDKLRELKQQQQDLSGQLQNAHTIRRSTNSRRKMIQNVIGKEDNQELREELDRLHNELTGIIEEKQRETIQNDVEGQVRKSARSRMIPRIEAESSRETFVRGTPRSTTYMETTRNSKNMPRTYTNSEQAPRMYTRPQVQVQSRPSNSPVQTVRRVSNRISQQNGTPGVTYGTPNVTYGTPNGTNNTYGTPNGTYSTQGVRYGAPNVTYGTPGIKYESKGVKNETPGVKYGTPRKSLTRYYTVDKDGNKTYADNQEQTRLQEVERKSGIIRASANEGQGSS